MMPPEQRSLRALRKNQTIVMGGKKYEQEEEEKKQQVNDDQLIGENLQISHAHSLDSSQELELEIIKREMQADQIQPFDEILDNQRKTYGEVPHQDFKSLQSHVDTLDYQPDEFKDLFRKIRMDNAERNFKIFGIAPPKKEKRQMKAADLMNAMSLKIMQIEALNKSHAHMDIEGSEPKNRLII